MPHESVLLFLLFLVQKCTKKGSNPKFLELWDLVLMSLMILEKTKKIPLKISLETTIEGIKPVPYPTSDWTRDLILWW